MSCNSNSPKATPFGELLFVCTANIARSPAAELLLRGKLPKGLSKKFKVRSAGTHALVGSPVDPKMATLLQSEGIDTSGFRSRQLSKNIAVEATIILTATTEHRSHVARLLPAAREKTFTMVEFVNLLSVESRLQDQCKSLAECLTRAEIERFRGQGASGNLDIKDPYGRSSRIYRSSFAKLDRVTSAILDHFL